MITDYATLKSTIATWLNRADLTTAIPAYIQLAEDALRTDARLKSLTSAALLIDSARVTLPADLKSVEEWIVDGVGPISTTSAGLITAMPASGGSPSHAAFVGRTAWVAPYAGGSYPSTITYWRTLPPLTDTASTNWLLDDHSNLYLYASLLQAAPYLREDERVPLWAAIVDSGLNGIKSAADSLQYGGRVRRAYRAIGG